MKSSVIPVYLDSARRSGFSLIEVVLAIGIFLVTVLALVGLLGPTLQSVDEVEKTDEVASVVNTVNAFLQSSSKINPDGSKFDAIYQAVKSGDFATVLVFRAYASPADSSGIGLKVGFQKDENAESPDPATPIDISAAILADSEFADAAATIYRVVLSASSVLPTPTATPEKYRSTDRTNGIYTMKAALGDYEEGSFAMEVRIFAENPGPTFSSTTDLATLADEEPIFTYNTAVVR
ncbi:MAG: hypothetical protein ABS34_13245 [Opitutaceae bacterium BACL24 MAG-120322-bin51]|nr:MAG: hypothetical protein ABS34_13245 [Opitutaceae bacterium BACL24 MAG-120322-bin51]